MNKKQVCLSAARRALIRHRSRPPARWGISSSCLLRQMPAFWPPVSRKKRERQLAWTAAMNAKMVELIADHEDAGDPDDNEEDEDDEES